MFHGDPLPLLARFLFRSPPSAWPPLSLSSLSIFIYRYTCISTQGCLPMHLLSWKSHRFDHSFFLSFFFCTSSCIYTKKEGADGRRLLHFKLSGKNHHRSHPKKKKEQVNRSRFFFVFLRVSRTGRPPVAATRLARRLHRRLADPANTLKTGEGDVEVDPKAEVPLFHLRSASSVSREHSLPHANPPPPETTTLAAASPFSRQLFEF